MFNLALAVVVILNLCWVACITIHRMTPSHDELNECSNPEFKKIESICMKPRVQIKALLHKSHAGKNGGRLGKVSAAVDLARKIIVIIKFTNRGKTVSDEEYIVVDHVTDQKTKASYRLLNPLVFRAKQDQIKQMYPLKPIRTVNWSPYEEVINKNNKNYQGCSTDGPSATCGVQSDSNNRPVEFSEGFCCSCDAYVNMNRQPADLTPEFIHLPLESGDERIKRSSDQGRTCSDNMGQDSGFNFDGLIGKDLDERQEELSCRAVNVWTRRVVSDIKEINKRGSNQSRIRRKKEIHKFILGKAQTALNSLKSQTLNQLSNLHIDELFEGKPGTETNFSMLTRSKYEKFHPYPNYITVPGFETAYGFTSNDSRRIHTMCDPWDSSTKDKTEDGDKNRQFFHELGEIQTRKVHANRHSSNGMGAFNSAMKTCGENTSKCPENKTLVEISLNASFNSTNSSELKTKNLTGSKGDIATDFNKTDSCLIEYPGKVLHKRAVTKLDTLHTSDCVSTKSYDFKNFCSSPKFSNLSSKLNRSSVTITLEANINNMSDKSTTFVLNKNENCLHRSNKPNPLVIIVTARNVVLWTDSKKKITTEMNRTVKSGLENTYLYLKNNQVNSFQSLIANNTSDKEVFEKYNNTIGREINAEHNPYQVSSSMPLEYFNKVTTQGGNNIANNDQMYDESNKTVEVFPNKYITSTEKITKCNTNVTMERLEPSPPNNRATYNISNQNTNDEDAIEFISSTSCTKSDKHVETFDEIGINALNHTNKKRLLGKYKTESTTHSDTTANKKCITENTSCFKIVTHDEYATQNTSLYKTRTHNENVTENTTLYETVSNDEHATKNTTRYETLSNDEHATENTTRFETLSNDEHCTENTTRYKKLSNDEEATEKTTRYETLSNDEHATENTTLYVTQSHDEYLTERNTPCEIISLDKNTTCYGTILLHDYITKGTSPHRTILLDQNVTERVSPYEPILLDKHTTRYETTLLDKYVTEGTSPHKTMLLDKNVVDNTTPETSFHDEFDTERLIKCTTMLQNECVTRNVGYKKIGKTSLPVEEEFTQTHHPRKGVTRSQMLYEEKSIKSTENSDTTYHTNDHETLTEKTNYSVVNETILGSDNSNNSDDCTIPNEFRISNNDIDLTITINNGSLKPHEGVKGHFPGEKYTKSFDETFTTTARPATSSLKVLTTVKRNMFVSENGSLVHFTHVLEINSTNNTVADHNKSYLEISIIQPENKTKSIPAEYSLEEVNESISDETTPNFSDTYDVHIISNLTLTEDALRVRNVLEQTTDKQKCKKYKSKQKRKKNSHKSHQTSRKPKQKYNKNCYANIQKGYKYCKNKINHTKEKRKTRKMLSFLKQKWKRPGSEDRKRIFEKPRKNGPHAKDISMDGKCARLTDAYKKKYSKFKGENLNEQLVTDGIIRKYNGCYHNDSGVIESLSLLEKDKVTKRTFENDLESFGNKMELFNESEVEKGLKNLYTFNASDTDSMEANDKKTTKEYNDTVSSDSQDEGNMELLTLEDSFDPNSLKLKQDVLRTLLELLQDESLIQTYNQMKLYANRSLLKREVEQLEKDMERNMLQHDAGINMDVRKLVKRQITSSGIQVRGGQSCVDRVVPSYVSDPDAYHESAHCLRFSDVWYTLYKLGGPFIEHSLDVKIFEKHYVPKNANHWRQLTKGMSTRLRTSSRHLSNLHSKCSKCPSIFINYLPLENNRKGPFSLKSDAAYLAAPQHNCRDCANIQGGPGEYLLVPPDDVTLEGDVCNKIGVGYRAFATQPMRCAQPRATCLGRQIADLWQVDKKAKDAKRRGKYFLENFASVSQDSHYVNITTREEYLGLEYLGSYTSAVELEIDNHFHTVVKVGESASISEVHIDATCKQHTKLGILVTNHGLTSAQFRVNLTDCPPELHTSCAGIENHAVTIHPQQRKIFRVSLAEDLPLDRFFLVVLLANAKQQRIASRKIEVQKLDRCFCVHHCACSCTGSMSGLECELLPVVEYHDAGFIGSLPEDSDIKCDDFSHLFSSLLSGPNVNSWLTQVVHFIVVFLLLGIAKALIGFACLDYVGNYGIWMLVCVRAKSLSAYLEEELKDQKVIYDEFGYPLHPKYLTRSVRYISESHQFLLNIFFYILLILVVVKNIILNYFYLCLNMLSCCWENDSQETMEVQERMRGGGSKPIRDFQEAEDYIRNANREVLEILYSAHEEFEPPVRTPCCAINSDSVFELQSIQKSAKNCRIHQDTMSEPMTKN